MRRLLVLLPLLAACATRPSAPAPQLAPFSGAGQPKVMFLGSFHFQDAGLDDYKPKHSLDVMSSRRQKEVEEVVDRLARFAPTKIGIEVKAENEETINQRYRDYLAGKYELKENEIYQLAFRLARRMGHERLYAIDVMGRRYEPAVDLKETAKRLGQESLVETQWDAAYKKLYEHDDELKTRRTLRETLRYINSPERVLAGHGHYVSGAFRIGGNGDYSGADSLTGWWYNRNLRIVSNVLRLAAAPNDRVFVLIGAGHLPIILHAAEASPEIELVDPRSVL